MLLQKTKKLINFFINKAKDFVNKAKDFVNNKRPRFLLKLAKDHVNANKETLTRALKYANGNFDILLEAAKNPKATKEILTGIRDDVIRDGVSDKGILILVAMASNPNAIEVIANIINTHYSDLVMPRILLLLQEIAKNHDTRQEILTQIMESLEKGILIINEKILDALADNHNITEDLLRRIINICCNTNKIRYPNYPRIAEKIAANPNVTTKMLIEMLEDPILTSSNWYAFIAIRIVRNHNATPEILIKIMRDPVLISSREYHHIETKIVIHPQVTPEILIEIVDNNSLNLLKISRGEKPDHGFDILLLMIVKSHKATVEVLNKVMDPLMHAVRRRNDMGVVQYSSNNHFYDYVDIFYSIATNNHNSAKKEILLKLIDTSHDNIYRARFLLGVIENSSLYQAAHEIPELLLHDQECCRATNIMGMLRRLRTNTDNTSSDMIIKRVAQAKSQHEFLNLIFSKPNFGKQKQSIPMDVVKVIEGFYAPKFPPTHRVW